MNYIKFGYRYRDIITGFEGIIETFASFVTGCDRVKLINGIEEKDKYWTDVPLLEFIDSGVKDKLSKNSFNSIEDLGDAKFNFKDKVKDTISDFEGIIIAKSISITGDINYGVCPKYIPDNKDNSAVWYDESRLLLLKKHETKNESQLSRAGGATCDLRIR